METGRGASAVSARSEAGHVPSQLGVRTHQLAQVRVAADFGSVERDALVVASDEFAGASFPKPVGASPAKGELHVPPLQLNPNHLHSQHRASSKHEQAEATGVFQQYVFLSRG